MARPAPRHDRDAGGPADLLAAKAALRQEVWSAMRAAKVARFPGAVGRIPNFTGAEAAAERLRTLPAWQAAGTVKANPDSARARHRLRPRRAAADRGHLLGGPDRGEDRGHPPARRTAAGPVVAARRRYRRAASQSAIAALDSNAWLVTP